MNTTETRNAVLRAAAMALVIASTLLSCMTVPAPEDIPSAMTPMQMIQRAQESFDAGNYESALVYYSTAIDRNRDNMAVVCQCEYEIAFIHYKQGDYVRASEELEILLARYENDKTFSLPLEYKRLSEIIVAKIVEETATK